MSKEPEEKKFQLAAYASAQQLRTHISESDADNDGLLDWEESLWGSDPHNADTDSDGTPDGQEARGGRNPSIAGPDDAVVSGNATTGTSTEAGVTDALAKEFFGSYLTLKQSNQLTEENKAELFQTLATRAADRLSIDTITIAELSIVPATQESKSKYQENLQATLVAVISPPVSELELVRRVYAGEPDATTTLAATIANMDTATEQLLTLNVPHDASAIHLKLVNTLRMYARAIEGMALLNQDPLRAAASTQTHAIAESHLRELQIELGAYLETN